uniref:Uncharacterized protein n=1 Tax=Pinctada fucata TaxID=50426 RepID=A0A194AM84_PINFU
MAFVRQLGTSFLLVTSFAVILLAYVTDYWPSPTLSAHQENNCTLLKTYQENQHADEVYEIAAFGKNALGEVTGSYIPSLAVVAIVVGSGIHGLALMNGARGQMMASLQTCYMSC